VRVFWTMASTAWSVSVTRSAATGSVSRVYEEGMGNVQFFFVPEETWDGTAADIIMLPASWAILTRTSWISWRFISCVMMGGCFV